VKKDPVKIGYFSGSMTHNRDFMEASGALLKVLKTYPNTLLHIVGDLELPGEFAGFKNRIIRKSFVLYLDMLKYMSGLDINIAPLEQNNPYNEGKSELKIFEAGLVGVPTIASRVDSYSKCISDGKNGLLAGSNEEWLDKLSLLVLNSNMRSSIGMKARNDFTKAFYIENAIENIVGTYENILQTIRGKK
jgi:O-antigen biosynthesis protein